MFGMRLRNAGKFRREFFRGEAARRLEQAVPRFRLDRERGYERGVEQFEQNRNRLIDLSADAFDIVRRERAAENGQRGEKFLLTAVEQRVTPRESRVHRFIARA